MAIIQRSFSNGKLRETTKSYREDPIVLSDTALEIAERYIKDKLPDAFLFINKRTNGHYTPRALWRTWKKYSDIDITLYEASRHSFITQLVDDDVQPLVLQKMARHTDIRTTMRYYHAATKKLQGVANRRGKGKVVDIISKRRDRNRTEILGKKPEGGTS